MKPSLGLALAALCVASAAHGQEPKFEYGKKEEVKEVEWKASASAGFVLTTGNSRTLTLSGSAAASRKAGDDKLGLEAAGAYARSDVLVFTDKDMSGTIGPGEIDRETQTTAKNWLVKLRYDRFFAEKNSGYLAGKVGADEPAGKTLYGGGQIGYSRQLYKDEQHEVLAEIGYDFSYESYVAPNTKNQAIHSARLFAGYTGKLTEDTGLLANVEALFNLNEETGPTGDISSFEDTRVIAKTALTTKLAKHIDFRFAFTLKFDNAPAALPTKIPFAMGFVPLADTVDTQTEATLIVNFL
jgi:putative salt-induced outer membrane protein YdiY